MLALYLGSAAFGVVLVAVSLILGGHDSDVDSDVDAGADLDTDVHVDTDVNADFDVDVDADVDLDADHGADVHGHAVDAHHDGSGGGPLDWLPLTSMRFWTFFLGTFGLTGTGLTFGSVPWPIALGVSLATGIAIGWGAALLFRALLTNRVSGDAGLISLVGRDGVVVVAVRPGGRGKIAITTDAGRLELPAVTGDGRALERGERVLVANVDHNVADITGLGPERRIPQRATERA